MRIWIIGGWAAGMMCAASLLHHAKLISSERKHLEIHLFEKNPKLWAKVIISWGGRCNVTAGITDKKELLTKYIRGADFLKPALGIFGPTKIVEWFEMHGVLLKTEDDQRVFPVSDDGKDVVGAFEYLFERENVQIHLRSSVLHVRAVDGVFALTISEHETEQIKQVDAVILTTWGTAYRHTWSTGDGYTFAESCGHTIAPLWPSLNSFLVEEQRIKDLSGIAFPNAWLRFAIPDSVDGKNVSRVVNWPLLCTHFWISGPVTFTMSAHLPYVTIDQTHPFVVHVIFEVGVSFEQRDQRIVKRTQEFPARQLKTQLHTAFPERVVEKICSALGLEPTQQLAHLTKEQRKQLVHGLADGLPLTLLARRPGDEFVTAGGVVLAEVDNKTMQSKISPGLYFGGEVLDIDGVTWGFNLTSSWATGWVAGKAIIEKW